jgi:hypothetical protein
MVSYRETGHEEIGTSVDNRHGTGVIIRHVNVTVLGAINKYFRLASNSNRSFRLVSRNVRNPVGSVLSDIHEIVRRVIGHSGWELFNGNSTGVSTIEDRNRSR